MMRRELDAKQQNEKTILLAHNKLEQKLLIFDKLINLLAHTYQQITQFIDKSLGKQSQEFTNTKIKTNFNQF